MRTIIFTFVLATFSVSSVTPVHAQQKQENEREARKTKLKAERMEDIAFKNKVKKSAPKKNWMAAANLAGKMTDGHRLLFQAKSCEGKPFRLSDIVPSEVERKVLTDGPADLVLQGDADDPICKELKEKIVFDPAVTQLNDIVKVYLSSANNQKRCNLNHFVNWHQNGSKFTNVHSHSKIKLFQQPSGMEMTLRLNDGSTQRGKGLLTFHFDGKAQSVPVDLEGRGGIRARWCSDFPPFKMILPKEDKTELFKSADRDMKVVTHCQKNPGDKEVQMINREYTVYKILEASGLAHFKTQLVQMKYQNANGEPFDQGPAILIENQKNAFDRMTKKDGSLKEGIVGTSREELNVAEDLVQNTDWSPGHNTRDVDPGANQLWVPYDFDLTKLVGHQWAEGKIPDTSASVRYGKETSSAIKTMVSNEANMLAAIADSPMTDSDKDKFTQYIKAKVESYRKLIPEE
ncbi:MAG: hypothetical protein JNL01_16950 [Bdellovibrionales bacterium]|nr:hypothetical protein [Bdellovibrionales bacterium]